MATAKVTLNNVVLIDATPATAVAADITSPKTAMLANGVVTQGTESGGGGVTPTGNINITQAGQTDVTNYATATVPNAIAMAGILTDFVTESNQRKWQLTATVFVDPEDGGQAGWIAEGVADENIITFNAVPANTTITPSTSAQTIGGVRHMMEGPVTVAAMPSGTAGTPTATKGTVSNHSITITPSVTNTTGYITGGTKTGTAVTVSASELVSGTLYCDDAGTWGVTNAETFVVDAGTEGTPIATKSAVSNHAVTVTPSVTNTEGWITGSTKTGTAVTVTAAELESGTLQITENDTGISVSGYSAVDVAVPDSNFVVTIGWDDVNELWLPDKTLAEIEEAYLQNIPIVTTSIDQQSVMVTGNCFQDTYSYYVFDGTTLTAYVLYDNGLPRVGYTYDLYDTSDATISSNNQLLNGIKAIGADGTVYTGNIPSKSSSDLTASGATVTIPAGYYSSQTTKSVSTTTHPNPTASINSSTGLVTASHTQTAGYVSAGTTTGTLQLTTQAAATITPTTSSQTAVAAGRYTTGAVTVAAIPSNYVDASSLKTYYTGSSAPSSSLGSNGDLYFQTSGA